MPSDDAKIDREIYYGIKHLRLQSSVGLGWEPLKMKF